MKKALALLLTALLLLSAAPLARKKCGVAPAPDYFAVLMNWRLFQMYCAPDRAVTAAMTQHRVWVISPTAPIASGEASPALR